MGPTKTARTEQFIDDLNTLFAVAIRHSGDGSILQRVLDAGLRAVGGHRGFLALVNYETGDLSVECTAGDGWTEETRRLRLSLGQETDRGITGHVAVTCRPYFTGDVDHDPYYLRYFSDVKSEIAVPILGGQRQARGVINVDSPDADAFGEADARHLMVLAQSAGAALAMEGFRARETALIEIGKSLTGTIDVEALMDKAVDITAKALRYEDCSAFLVDEQAGHLVLQASHGALADHRGKASYRLGEGLTGWVAENGQPIRLAEPHTDPRWVGRFTEMPEHEIGAFLAVPIVGRDKVLGVLRVLRRKSHSRWFSNRFTETDERVLGTIGSQLGIAIENARAFQKLLRSERMAAWGELSAKSAHMIGNRAFALKGDLNELGYVIESLPQDVHRREIEALARSMSQGVTRLEEILREFRDFVMATQLSLAECDLNVLAQEVVDETFPKRTTIRLEVALSEQPLIVRCDAAKLGRALSELVENAVSFMPDGGVLRVATSRVSECECGPLRLTPCRCYARIEVADTGPGVPDEARDRIFLPFYTSRAKGMGLGLSIVKGIVEAHGGRVREVGEAGAGARFVMFLPVCG